MAQRSKNSIIGAVGAVILGGSILLFVGTLILNNLKSSAYPHDGSLSAGELADWASLNTSVDQLQTFLTVCAILLGILGIVLIGAAIIGSLGGAFGG